MLQRGSPKRRDLTALFGVEVKAAIARAQPKRTGPQPRTQPRQAAKVCPGGHRMPDRWRARDGCWRCDREKEAIAPELERASRRQALGLGTPPHELTIPVVESGRVMTFRIPPHLHKRLDRRRRRR